MALKVVPKFVLIQDEQTIRRLFTDADEDIMTFAADRSQAYREGMHRAYLSFKEDPNQDDSWVAFYSKVQGFWVKMKGRKVDFITVGIKSNAQAGMLKAMSKNNVEMYNDVKPGKINIEQLYIDLREGFNVIRTTKQWICLYKTAAGETFASLINRDNEPNANIVELINIVRQQQGLKNYGFSE